MPAQQQALLYNTGNAVSAVLWCLCLFLHGHRQCGFRDTECFRELFYAALVREHLQNDMTADLRVGVIIKPHGVRGELKVYPTTDNPSRFDEITHVKLIQQGRPLGDFKVEGVKYFKDIVILKLEGFGSINEVESLKGAELYIPREEGAALNEGEYYIADIIGMEVVTDDGTKLGAVRDVMETGANDVYVVDRGGNKELLIPAIKQCILNTDINENVMTVHLMDGLMEL